VEIFSFNLLNSFFFGKVFQLIDFSFQYKLFFLKTFVISTKIMAFFGSKSPSLKMKNSRESFFFKSTLFQNLLSFKSCCFHKKISIQTLFSEKFCHLNKNHENFGSKSLSLKEKPMRIFFFKPTLSQNSPF